MLPYLDEQPLYDSYHFDEPWDSEHNKRLIETMPDVFQCPLDDADSGNTSYFGFTSDDMPPGYKESAGFGSDSGGGYEAPQGSSSFEGKADNQPHQATAVPGTTAFWKHTGCRFRNITDGTSYTIAVVEAKRSVPWTQPTDIEYSRDQPLPEPGGWWKQGTYTAFVDGKVKFLATYSDQDTIRHLITIGDGVHVEPQEASRFEVREATDQEPESGSYLQFDDAFLSSLQYVTFDSPPVLTEQDVQAVSISPDANDTPFVNIEMTLTDKAGMRFFTKTTQLSSQSPQGVLAIVFDGELIFAPRVRTAISNKLVITGLQDRNQAEQIVTHLQRTIYLYRDDESDDATESESQEASPNAQLSEPARPQFATPEELMEYFADCQHRGDSIGAVNCYSDKVINDFATSYLLTASIMVSSADEVAADRGAIEEIESLLDESLAEELSGAEAAALAQATELYRDGFKANSRDELRPYELALIASTPSILKNPRQFTIDFIRLTFDGDDDSSESNPQDKPYFTIERSGGNVWAVDSRKGTRFELQQFGRSWLISDPWPDAESETNAPAYSAVDRDDPQLIHKSNVQNLRRGEGTRLDLESIITVSISGDSGIDWHFSEEPLK